MYIHIYNEYYNLTPSQTYSDNTESLSSKKCNRGDESALVKKSAN